MEGSLQNKLQQFEIAPPPAVWEQIAASLDQEFSAADSMIAGKLENAEVVPPAAIWTQINEQLSAEPMERPTVKVVSRRFIRIAVAAAITGLIALGLVYLLNDNNAGADTQIVNNVPQKQEPVASIPNENKNTEQPAITRTKPDNPRNASASFKAKPRRNETNEQIEPVMPSEGADAVVSPEQAPLYELTTVSALQPVSISAPPIRDNKGNLILDIASISHPNDQYIVVTGPNGKQTRLSSKFLSCLGYMNTASASTELDPRALRCNLQFEEWRNRLLSEPAFIPTANNFFDIFELKDMLQEM